MVMIAVRIRESAKSLARGAFVTAESMLGIVANLEMKGLLHRTPHQTH